MQVDTTECSCWQNQNVIRTWIVLVHATECKSIQHSVVIGKTRMLLGQGNVAVNKWRWTLWQYNGYMHDLYGLFGLETKTFDWPTDFTSSWEEIPILFATKFRTSSSILQYVFKKLEFYIYYLLTGCKGRTRKYKSKVFHTARACEGCLENQGLVFPGTARAPS